MGREAWQGIVHGAHTESEMFNKHLLVKDARNVMEEMQKDRQGAKGQNRTF